MNKKIILFVCMLFITGIAVAGTKTNEVVEYFLFNNLSTALKVKLKLCREDPERQNCHIKEINISAQGGPPFKDVLPSGHRVYWDVGGLTAISEDGRRTATFGNSCGVLIYTGKERGVFYFEPFLENRIMCTVEE